MCRVPFVIDELSLVTPRASPSHATRANVYVTRNESMCSPGSSLLGGLPRHPVTYPEDVPKRTVSTLYRGSILMVLRGATTTEGPGDEPPCGTWPPFQGSDVTFEFSLWGPRRGTAWGGLRPTARADERVDVVSECLF